MNEEGPAKMRAEAIDALSTWAKPSVLDRVDGRYRGVIQRDPALVNNKAADPMILLLKNKEFNVRISAVKAIAKLGISQGAAPLLGLLKNDPRQQCGLNALKALHSCRMKQIDQAIQQALSDKDKTVRIAGIDLLGTLNISKELMVSLLSEVINSKTTEEKQAALLTLGKLPVENSEKFLTSC